MARIFCLVTMVIAMTFPALGTAGEISFRLPLSYWNMASCTSPGKDTEAHCRWQANGKGGVDINCTVQAIEASQSREITLDIDIKPVRPHEVDRSPGLRKFSYDYSGIGCWAYVPTGMDNLACRTRSNGFKCSWCTGYYCYEGQASLIQKTIKDGGRNAGRGLALGGPIDSELWD